MGAGIGLARQNNIKGGQIDAFLGKTDGKTNIYAKGTLRVAKDGKATSHTSRDAFSWTEEDVNQMITNTQTTTRTDTTQSIGHSNADLSIGIGKRLSPNVQGIIEATYHHGHYPEEYKKGSVGVGIDARGQDGSVKVKFNTNKDTSLTGEYKLVSICQCNSSTKIRSQYRSKYWIELSW